jgi:hypothetical protein
MLELLPMNWFHHVYRSHYPRLFEHRGMHLSIIIFLLLFVFLAPTTFSLRTELPRGILLTNGNVEPVWSGFPRNISVRITCNHLLSREDQGRFPF